MPLLEAIPSESVFSTLRVNSSTNMAHVCLLLVTQSATWANQDFSPLVAADSFRLVACSCKNIIFHHVKRQMRVL